MPIHLEEDVKAILDRDISLGVIKKLPVNTQTKWCARIWKKGKRLEA